MIAYRLADSLPKEVLARIDAEIKAELGLGVPSGKMARPGHVDFGRQAAERRK